MAGHALYLGSGLGRLGHKIWQDLRASPILPQHCRTNVLCTSEHFRELEHLNTRFSLAAQFGEPMWKACRHPSLSGRLNLHLGAGYPSGSEVQPRAWHACPGLCVAVCPRQTPLERGGTRQAGERAASGEVGAGWGDREGESHCATCPFSGLGVRGRDTRCRRL